MSHHVAATDVLHGQPVQIQGNTVSGLGDFLSLTVTLNAADMGKPAAGQKFHFIAAFRVSGNKRAGHYGTVPLEREHTVHGQSEKIGTAAGLTAALLHNGGPQCVEPFSRDRRYGKNGSLLQERSLQKVPHVLLGQLQHVGVHHVDLGQRHNAVTHAEQRADFQMFAGLRHDSLVGGNDQQNEIYTGGSGHHGTHETLMSRHVHNAHALPSGKIGVGKTQFYGDAAALFFAETVAIYTCKCPDERCLAVVDMPGGSHDDRHDGS